MLGVMPRPHCSHSAPFSRIRILHAKILACRLVSAVLPFLEINEYNRFQITTPRVPIQETTQQPIPLLWLRRC